jgi:hypothetical protein
MLRLRDAWVPRMRFAGLGTWFNGQGAVCQHAALAQHNSYVVTTGWALCLVRLEQARGLLVTVAAAAGRRAVGSARSFSVLLVDARRQQV